MSIRVNPDGRNPIRNLNIKPQLPKGVTMTAQRVKERIIRRPDNGAQVSTVDGGQTVTIGNLSRDEATLLMLDLLEKQGMEYVGFDIGLVLFPGNVEKVS